VKLTTNRYQNNIMTFGASPSTPALAWLNFLVTRAYAVKKVTSRGCIRDYIFVHAECGNPLHLHIASRDTCV